MTPAFEEMESVRINRKSDAKEYIGKGIWYLRSIDIDKSGRGYFFPKFMRVDEIIGSEFYDAQDGAYVPYREILRIKVIP